MLTDAEIRAALTDHETLGLTAWAEARGDGHEGHSSVEERIAVMAVIRNRTRRGRLEWSTYKRACLADQQFSCWNPGTDGNHLALLTLADRVVTGQPMRDPLALETFYLARGIMNDVILDTTGGATHYYAPASMVPAGAVPHWAAGLTPLAIIGRQHFFHLTEA